MLASAIAASVALSAGLAGAGPGATDAATAAIVRQAVRAAVHAAVSARMGDDVAVSIDTRTIRVTDDAEGLVATPDASGRTGRPTRFVLSARTNRGRARVGEVTAVVGAIADVVRTTRPLARGDLLGTGDVIISREPLTGAPFRPLQTLSTAIGARTTRDLAAGALVGANDLLAEPTVKNNTVVRALIRMGTAEIEADVLAMDAGARGDIIRVSNTGTRRVFRARVTGKGRVEVLEP